MAATTQSEAFIPSFSPTLRPSKHAKLRPRPGPQSCARPPEKRVRLPRCNTYHARNWPWRGRRPPRWPPRGLRRLLELVWSDDSEGALVSRVARLGYVVLAALSQALQRSLAPSEKELVVEYGITEPNPNDKFYVHPLREWEPAKSAFYYDSRGRPVVLCAHAPNGLAIALEFCDAAEEEEGVKEGEGEGGRGKDEPTATDGEAQGEGQMG